MKESLPDTVLLLEVDRTATASSASNESRSLQLLLVLHTLVGGAELRRANGQLGMYQARSAIQLAAASRSALELGGFPQSCAAAQRR